MKHAFTLIELLIVVAIIAILAAIAVPNFLEAQTRSKVSRCKSDLRTIATALESYRVDNTSYPNDGGSGVASPTFVNSGGIVWARLGVITSPIAYITAIPPDPFLTVPHENRTWLYSYIYMCNNKNCGPFVGDSDLSDADVRSRMENVRKTFWNVPDHLWLMFTSGPDRVPDFAKVPPYDSTNGTISKGDIWYFGPGGKFTD